MPRSLLRGDYSLLLAIESSSRPHSWYRVLADRESGLLSCDCPPWTFNQNHDGQGRRSCPHTIVTSRLATTAQATVPASRPLTPTASLSPLLIAAQTQWPGLRGTWSIEERDTVVGTKPYHFVLLRLAMGTGGTATGIVAFASRHHHTENEMIAGVAGWAGYALAAEVARLGGFPMAGQVPEHFRIDRHPTGRQRQRPTTPSAVPTVSNIGLADILRVGDMVDQGDGLRPEQRAENTLRLFLGETLYQQVERQGFLDISSVRYASDQRVYRLRRDPAKRSDRRIRVFERNRYARDLCVVRAMECPEADMFLTNFLGLLSDEDAALSVVNPHHNVFSPYSDGNERETIPAVWVSRVTVSTV